MTKKFIEFTDDFMFCSVLRYFSKEIRLDIYVTDIENNSYDIEMQTTLTKDLPLRIRYYHSEMDSYSIRKGMKYNELGRNIVIFVCLDDPFGYDESIYTFKNTCQEYTHLLLEDKTDTIILNVNGKRDKTSKKLSLLLDYIKSGQANDEFTRELQEQVCLLNEDSVWRNNYMKLEWKLNEREEMGKKIGIKIGQYKVLIPIVKDLYLIDKSTHDIADFTKSDVQTIQSVIDALEMLGSDATDQDILSFILNRKS